MKPQHDELLSAWSDTVCTCLKLPWNFAFPYNVPFRLVSNHSSDAEMAALGEVSLGMSETRGWKAHSFDKVGANTWQLGAGLGENLTAEFQSKYFEDTHSVECWGQIRNTGTHTVPGIRDACILDIELADGGSAIGQPWLRVFRGVTHQPPGYFPPDDFSPRDCQLLKIDRSPRAVIVDSGPNGWSSESFLPCAILCDEKQQHGLALFLEWSGMWHMAFQMSRNSDGSSKGISLRVGITGLELSLAPGENIPLPRLLITSFRGDAAEGSNALRKHIRRHVTPKLAGSEITPPVSFNHFFGLGYNNFTDASLRPAIDVCGKLGVEYFCVDGGWNIGGFRQGIGNWEEDPEKFPHGLKNLTDYVRSRGMQYGTWFEPEWAHQNSPFYREHPDWFWKTPVSHPLERSASQHYFHSDCHLLNLGIPEARLWVLHRLVRAYEEWGMRWIRYDFNQIPRPNWEQGVPAYQIGRRQIQYVQGLYTLLDDLMSACPDLLIEQTASGGHRLDLGTVRRGHTFWMNDHTHHTDIVRALQLGLNRVLPGNYTNSNICQLRLDYDDYDFLSHGAGPLGISLPIHQMTQSQFANFKKGIVQYKRYRHLLLGDFQTQGNPNLTSDHVSANFSDGSHSAVMEFNYSGPRSAKLTIQ